jgi:hypothetical protein
MISERVSPILARCENNSTDDTSFTPASNPPLSPKVSTAPAPLGEYFCASA